MPFQGTVGCCTIPGAVPQAIIVQAFQATNCHEDSCSAANVTTGSTDLLGLLRRDTAEGIVNSFLEEAPEILWNELLEPGSTECAEALLKDVWEQQNLIDFAFDLGVSLMFTAIGLTC